MYKIIREKPAGCSVDDTVYRRLLFIMSRILLENGYDVVCRFSSDFLYPYPAVKKGSRIIVYGAGITGTRMIESLAEKNEYIVAAWIDTYERNKNVGTVTVHGPEYIKKVEYDKIVIAIIEERIAGEIKKSLIDMGIEEEKIACMDAGVISEEMLEKCLRSYK